MSSHRPVAVDELDSVIQRILVGNPLQQGRHLLGIEYERLILHRATRESAPLQFCRELFELLVGELDGAPILDDSVVKGIRAEGFELSMEPGGQLELAPPPKANLAETDETVCRVSAVLDRVLAPTDFELVALGHAPVTPVSEIGILPRERYRIMDERMPARGRLTRNMMRATAGFQLTYDVDDAQDASRKMALLFRLSPVLMAITANSREIGGVDSGYASFRHKVWMETDTDRSGVPEGCLDEERAVTAYVRYARRARMLFFDRPGGLVPAPDRPLEVVVADGGVSEADVDLHLTSLFPFVRLRNYIEIRCFDSVPWPLARSVLALVSGLVYCTSAAAEARVLSERLVLEDPGELRRLHLDAARSGLETGVPGEPGVTFRDLACELVEFSAATLGGNTCDWAQPRDLQEVRELLAANLRPRRAPGA